MRNGGCNEGRDATRQWISALMLSISGLAGLGGLVACSSSEPGRAEFEPLIERGAWEEIRVRSAEVRQDGSSGVWIDLAEGLALLHQDEDRSAEPLLRRAVAADTTLAPRVAGAYDALARKDREAGWTDRARRRFVEAVRTVPTYEVGDQLDSVADYFYRFEKDYARALPLYRRLYRERPEPPTKHLEWVHRYGHCLEVLGSEDEAIAVYEEFIATWPNDVNIMRYVQWRHVSLLIARAERARAQNDPEGALALLGRCVSGEWHVDLAQRARYLAGEIEEERGQLAAARAWYQQVAEGGGRTSDQLIERARERLAALGADGAH